MVRERFRISQELRSRAQQLVTRVFNSPVSLERRQLGPCARSCGDEIGRHAQNAPAKPKRYAHCHRPQSRGKRGTARLEPFGRYQPRQGCYPGNAVPQGIRAGSTKIRLSCLDTVVAGSRGRSCHTQHGDCRGDAIRDKGAGADISERLTFWSLIIALVAAAVGSIFVLRWLHAIIVNPKSKSRTGGGVAHDIQEAASFPPIGASGPRMLVIRGVDDEASLTLAAGSIGCRLSSLVLFVVIPGVYLFGLALLALLDWSGVWRTELLFLVVMYGCAFGALVCLFLPGICKSAFGREFLTTAFVCETAADSAPDTSARLDSVTLSPVEAGRRLRHCIYEHPKCVDEIARWV